MNSFNKENRVIDHDEVLGLRVLFGFENLLSFDAKQLDRHAVRIPIVVVLTPAIRKTNQRLKGLRLAKYSMAEVRGEVGLNYKLRVNQAMLLRVLAARDRGMLSISFFLNVAVQRDNLVDLCLLANGDVFFAEGNSALFNGCDAPQMLIRNRSGCILDTFHIGLFHLRSCAWNR
jgi:hypothetical protein